MKLLSLIPSDHLMRSFDNSWKNINNFVKDVDLDGIETMIGTYHPTSYLKDANVKGLHLMYFPTWLDFWKGDLLALEKNFGSLERVKLNFGSLDRSALIEHYKKEFENAKELGVKYMVFHVSHVNPRDIFTFEYDYTSREVLEASIELINQVFVGDGPALLLENLFWPGLDLRSNEDTQFLLGSINYKNKGLLLDMSHLICTNTNISTFDEGARYILDKLKDMGDLVGNIRGIHLNASTPKNYLNQDFNDNLKKWELAPPIDRYHVEVDHIKNIDTHSVFESNLLKDILDIIPYEYLTLELSYTSKEDLLENIRLQSKFLDK